VKHHWDVHNDDGDFVGVLAGTSEVGWTVAEYSDRDAQVWPTWEEALEDYIDQRRA